MGSVLSLIIFLTCLALLAAMVVLYVTYTYRGLPIPGMGWVDHHTNHANAAITRRLGGSLENTAASGALIHHGMVINEGKDTDLRHRFWQAERRVVSKLPRSQRQRYEQRQAAPSSASTTTEAGTTITGEHTIALV